MKLPGVCDNCHRPRQVNVTPFGLAMLVGTRIARGVCDDCSARAPRSITCRVCKATSYNATDIETGWCGRCDRFTGKTLVEVELVLLQLRRRGDPSWAGVNRRLIKQKEEK